MGDKNKKVVAQQRAEHLHRLQKIKNRKPGEGGTLDNLPPDIVGVQNPAHKDQQVKNSLIYNENKSMLKRISLILTAPSQLRSTKEYYSMKKMVFPKSQSKRVLYEKEIIERQTVKFFNNLSKQKAFYKCKDFEHSYKVQAFNQKFMRQVNYKRPKGWIDPFADPPPPETEEQRKERYRQMRSKARSLDLRPGSNSKLLRSTASATGHANRIKQYKHYKEGKEGGESSSASSHNSNGAYSGRNSERGSVSSKGSKGSNRGDRRMSYAANSMGSNVDGEDFDITSTGGSRTDFVVGGDRVGYEDGIAGENMDPQQFSYDDDPDGYEGYQDRLDLMQIKRAVRVEVETHRLDSPTTSENGSHAGLGGATSRPNSARPTHRERNKEKLVTDIFYQEALVQCWLLDSEYVVISVTTINNSQVQDGRVLQYEAEAEIALEDLAVVRQGVLDEQDDNGEGVNMDKDSSPMEDLANNFPALQALAADIVQYVELIVEQGEARVVLQLAHEVDASTLNDSTSQRDEEYTQDDETQDEGDSATTPDDGTLAYSMRDQQTVQNSLLSNDEIDGLLLRDEDVTVLKRAVHVPVYYLNGGNEATQLWAEDATDKQIKKIRQNRYEEVYTLVKVQTNLNDDQLYISAFFVSRSLRKFKISIHKTRPAIESNTMVFGNTAMPSVIYADPDMVHSFASNVTSNLRIEHDCNNGENTLILQVR